MNKISKNYFEKRYKSGIGSGDGSIGKVRDFKHEILRKYLGYYNLHSFLDVGCGDLSFWHEKPPKHYIGVDFSKTIQTRNKLKFDRKFITVDIAKSVLPRADVIICFDVLFHILNDKDYSQIIFNMCRAAKKFVFIYTWLNEPKNYVRKHQKYRKLSDYFSLFIAYEFNYVGVYMKPEIDSIGALFVFKKSTI